jgi:hypothetical protein
MATATIVAAPNESASLVCNVALSFRLMSTSPSPTLDSIAGQRDSSCEISSDYSAAREADLDCLRFAAGFWLSIGTTNDRPKMSL